MGTETGQETEITCDIELIKIIKTPHGDGNFT